MNEKYSRAVNVFDKLSCMLYYGDDFKHCLMQSENGIALASLLIDEIEKYSITKNERQKMMDNEED